ncbi:hypothetical protein BJ165DRAFT_1477596 [Panaeolus papilionaceus]|nr:hypothetical protein BJ165DRAFT_1477596 [Panaeolus papilionaceus]
MTHRFATLKDLSYEVLDLIFVEICSDNDDANRKQTLGACRLVSTSFNSVALPHLFKSIRLVSERDCGDKAASERRVLQFHSLLQLNPSIATYIRSLRVDTGDYRQRTTNWILKNKILPQVLLKLTRLRHFTLRTHKGPLVWHNLNKALKAAILTIFHLSSILSLALRCIEGLPLDQVLYSPANFTTMKKSRVKQLSAPQSPTPGNLDQLTLCSFTIGSLSRVVSDSRPGGVHLRSIHKLRLLPVDEYSGTNHLDIMGIDEAWPNLLRTIKPDALRELELGSRNLAGFDKWPSGKPLTGFNQLSTISIVFRPSTWEFKRKQNIAGIASILKFQAPMPNIQNIKLFCWTLTGSNRSALQSFTLEALALLDQVLKDSTLYPQLKTFTLEFKLDPKRSNYYLDNLESKQAVVTDEEVKEHIRQGLLGLVGRPAVARRVITQKGIVMEL